MNKQAFTNLIKTLTKTLEDNQKHEMSPPEKEEYDSEAPEEFTAEQGLQQDEDLRKSERESKARIARDTKERRRKRAESKTPKKARSSGGGEIVQDALDWEKNQEPLGTDGMLSDEIINLLAAREKQVFLSDSEDDQAKEKPVSKKKKTKSFGLQTVFLNNMPSGQCSKNSLEFLKKRQMQVPRSNAVLNNSNQALRYLSRSGVLK